MSFPLPAIDRCKGRQGLNGRVENGGIFKDEGASTTAPFIHKPVEQSHQIGLREALGDHARPIPVQKPTIDNLIQTVTRIV